LLGIGERCWRADACGLVDADESAKGLDAAVDVLEESMNGLEDVPPTVAVAVADGLGERGDSRNGFEDVPVVVDAEDDALGERGDSKNALEVVECRAIAGGDKGATI